MKGGKLKPKQLILKLRLLTTALTNIKVWDQEYKNMDCAQYKYAKSESLNQRRKNFVS